MLDNLTQLLKAVISQLGVYLRGGVKGEVPHGLAGEEPPQIHRNEKPHILPVPAVGNLLGLEVQNGLHQGGT